MVRHYIVESGQILGDGISHRRIPVRPDGYSRHRNDEPRPRGALEDRPHYLHLRRRVAWRPTLRCRRSGGPCGTTSDRWRGSPSSATISATLCAAVRSTNTPAGYASGNIEGHYEPVKFGIVGATEHPQVNYDGLLYSSLPYAAAPSQAVNFVASHDGYTVVDKLKLSVGGDRGRRRTAPDRQTHPYHPAHGAGSSVHSRRRGDDAGQAGRTEQFPFARCRQPHRLVAETREPRSVRLHPGAVALRRRIRRSASRRRTGCGSGSGSSIRAIPA